MRTVGPEGGSFDEPEREAVLAELRTGPGEAARTETMPHPTGPRPSRWTLRAVRATLPALRGYTLSGAWRWLRRHGFRLRSAAVQHYSPDPEYAAKEARVRACLEHAAREPERVVALFLDEMSYRCWPDPGADWGPKAPAARPRTQHGGVKDQNWRVVGAVNARTGRTHHRSNYIVGRRELIRFYRDLAAAYPLAERIYVIQDNWSVHAHPDVQEALARRPQLEPVWLPTYAPWLNPQEKVWRWLREAVLKMHGSAADWPALQASVRDFLNQFKDGSRPLLRYIGLLGEGSLVAAVRAP